MKTAKMKSKPYKLRDKLFRYDFDTSMVEYIAKAEEEDIVLEKEWIEKYGRPIYGIGEDGYMVLDAAGLHKKNWNNKAARDEYLAEWANELDEEAEALARNFIKYEM